MSRLPERHKRSNQLRQRIHELIPGGSHTYSKGEDQFPALSPQLISRAKGAYCWDVDGNRFLDWAMGNRVFVLGHGNQAVNNAVMRQIDLGLNFTRPGQLELELAEYLVDLFPCAEMVKFAKNGSDVTSAAVRLARAYTGRKYVARCVDHPFFSVDDWFIGTTPVDAGIPHEISDLTLGFLYNDLDSLEQLVVDHPGEIAAVILEPVKNDEPVDGFLERLRALTEREGIVLIFDEMISGIRFDLRGAHHRYGVYPDLATFGKAISNGYSFSLLAGKREIMELGGLRHDARKVFLLSQTHGAEATGLAACRATLEECRRVDASAHIWQLGTRLASGMREIARGLDLDEHIRIIGFDCNPQIVCTGSSGESWPELHTALHEELIRRGILIPWISVTTAHGETELDDTLNAFSEAAEAAGRAIAQGAVDEAFDGDPVRPVLRPYNQCRQARCPRVDPSASRDVCCPEGVDANGPESG